MNKTHKTVRPGHHLVPCIGEAHSNPNIDNCGICAPRWGEVEVPKEFSSFQDYLHANDPYMSGFQPPTGWTCVIRSQGATLISPEGFGYHIDRVEGYSDRHTVSVFDLGAAVGNRLRVSDLSPATLHNQLKSTNPGDFAQFTNPCHAADAVLAHVAWREINSLYSLLRGKK